MYITVNRPLDPIIRVSYSKTEIVEHVEDIQHPIVREALKLVGIKSTIEITSIADIPARTGLGSSSSFTVGLLNALYAFKDTSRSAESLAQEAAYLEIDVLGEPIGKQDHYSAAYGGLQHFQFYPDESVHINPVICSREVKEKLNQNLLLFYTGIARSASEILAKQQANTTHENQVALNHFLSSAQELLDVLEGSKPLVRVGEILHENWKLKAQLAEGITNPYLDAIYEKAMEAGAGGGKILGAGGGGFFLFYCEPDRQAKLREALSDIKEVPFSFEPQGSQIIFIGS
jgi:D-glycero-alpha-D-manno-heptose-7-phosphate kinase